MVNLLRYSSLRVRDVLPHSCCGKFVALLISIAAFIFVILLLPSSLQQLGQKRVGLLRNKSTKAVDLTKLYRPGRYWIGFWREFVEYPSTVETMEWSSKPIGGKNAKTMPPIEFRDQEGAPVKLEVSVQYRLILDEIPQLHKEFLAKYLQVYQTSLATALQRVGTSVTARDMWEDYVGFREKVRVACENELRSRHAKVWDVQVLRVALQTRYEEKLLLTQVSKQKAETAQWMKQAAEFRSKTEAMLETYRADAAVMKTRGESAKLLIEREAYAIAEESTVKAQAKLLDIVRDVVSLSPMDGSGLRSMSNRELIKYQQMFMLGDQEEVNMVYGASKEESEVWGVRQLMPFEDNTTEDPLTACMTTYTLNIDEDMRSYSSVYTGAKQASFTKMAAKKLTDAVISSDVYTLTKAKAKCQMMLECKGITCDTAEKKCLLRKGTTLAPSYSLTSFIKQEVILRQDIGSRLNTELAWSAQENKVGEWLQMNLTKTSWVAGVVTQAAELWKYFVSEFTVKYLDTQGVWRDLGDVLEGSKSEDELEARFALPVQALAIRIYPTQWKSWMTLRAGLIVCGDGPARRLQEPQRKPHDEDWTWDFNLRDFNLGSVFEARQGVSGFEV